MYQINEIFYSIQGEGVSIGYPAIFVRFSGCNLACPFCDTEHDTFTEYSLDGLVSAIVALRAKLGMHQGYGFLPKDRPRCVFTGGEPMLQLDVNLIGALREAGFLLCIETNGTIGEQWLASLDEVTVSPKRPVDELPALRYATTIKVLVPVFEGIEVSSLVRKVNYSDVRRWKVNLVLQPIRVEDGVLGQFRKNCQEAVSLQKKLWVRHRQLWRVIPQVHRLMGII
jgi:organic radical activating enzyme